MKAWIFALLGLVMVAGCRIDHYAFVRVAVKDADTNEYLTNGNYTVQCSFPCFSFADWIGWRSQRSSVYSKNFKGESDGVAWFWGGGNTAMVNGWLYSPPEGYYKTHTNSEDGVAHFSTLWSFVPIPIQIPPVQFVTVYARRQQNPIEAEIHHIVDICGPRSNGVFLCSYRPSDKKMLTGPYQVDLNYDCMKGDYLPPYGKGEHTDIIFRHAFEYRGTRTNRWGKLAHDWTRSRTMIFPGKGNGLIFRNRPTSMNGHEFTSEDFLAPLDGYDAEVLSSYGGDFDENIGPTHACFIFRIRGEYDEGGKLVDCHYGLFDGRFSYYLGLYGDYYVNPVPMDRNLELKNGTQEDGGAIWRWW